MESNRGIAYVCAVVAALLLLPVSISSLRWPIPMPLQLPLFTGVPQFAVVAMPSVTFLMWCLPLFRRSIISRRRTLVSYSLVTVSSVAYFGSNWNYGLKYHGISYTLTMSLVSLGFATAIGGMLALRRRSSSQLFCLATGFFLVLWTFTFAFPYLGDFL